MAHFLIDASLPRAVADLLRARGHEATDVRDIGFGAAPDGSIADHARAERLCLISADGDFGHIAHYPPERFHGIVVVQPPRDASRAVVLALVERFLDAEAVLGSLAGHLVIVEPGRIRVRPAE
jgi:predicted nuclease of predicted toxin-antitoxin system